ncbi:MAG TPA: PQQ-dependent sugar dehydrogenase, partial [Rhizomicrobium sp.]|nr:PQQ-dependent sugar dehydrogenase [Rhizomicrobium sp.]
TPAVENSSRTVPRPKGALPQVPKGFSISLVASGLSHPRFMALAPNGDVFISEPDAGKISILHDGKVSTFASGGFNKPHGLAFRNGALYVADLIAVWKLGYKDGALHESGPRTRVTKDGFGPLGGHFSRDIAFDKNGALYIAIGSMSNVDEEQPPRATVQKVSADGHLSTFVSGTRNPVGLALKPGTNDLYIAVNERDGYGDALVPDYFTRISQGDFFGWPYAYSGPHADPDFGKKRPDLVAKTKVGDVLFQAHSAPLGIAFYDGTQFPAEYSGDAFVALHGSWNSGKPTGYKVVRVRFANGRPTGTYEDFVTGFWDGSSSPAKVWGRPVGLLVAKDGSLLISDDAGKALWRVGYSGK